MGEGRGKGERGRGEKERAGKGQRGKDRETGISCVAKCQNRVHKYAALSSFSSSHNI